MTRVREDPVFGAIPLIPEVYVGVDGDHEFWRYDPTFEPPLPRGAVRGDPKRQVFCSHHVPKYFYVDESRGCVQCGTSFVFRAAEQKYWYEIRQFNFHSAPARCLTCRRQRRTAHALGEHVGGARVAVQGAPKDPDAWLALARAIVELNQRTGHGRLDEGIEAARKAQRLWPGSSEPLLWEGLAQKLAGRMTRAKLALRGYLERGQGRGELLRMAKAELDALERGGRTLG